ncbi:MAG: amidohydrolase family protein [Chloroflexi bacterium]|nr:amidohydrolase family protein [Chloroflexota bacterium]
MEARTTVIRAGRLVDGTARHAVQRDQAIFIEGGVIQRVAPAGELAPDAEVLDLRDATVLPGLIDCHVHLIFTGSAHALRDVLADDDEQIMLRAVAAARRALRGGITTVRDLGGRAGVTLRVRDAIDEGLLAGPRILACGSPITITGGHCNFLGLEADGEAGVRVAARSQLKAGANCLKVMSTGGNMTPGTNIYRAQYSVPEIAAAVDEAARARVTVAAHGLGTDGIRNAVRAGVNTVEHCQWLGLDGVVSFDEAAAHEMAERRIAFVPTLAPRPAVPPPPRGQFLAAMRRAWEMGVPVAAGTDAGTTNRPFDSLPVELEAIVTELGLTPLEAIHSATGEAARAIGMADRVGTIQAGRVADLLVVDGDPSLRIEDLRPVKMVLQSGRTVVENGVLLR